MDQVMKRNQARFDSNDDEIVVQRKLEVFEIKKGKVGSGSRGGSSVLCARLAPLRWQNGVRLQVSFGVGRLMGVDRLNKWR